MITSGLTVGSLLGPLVDALKSIQLWVTIAPLIFAPLFFGSVDQLWVVVWITVLSIGTVLGSTSSTLSQGQRRVLIAFLAICCAYAVIAIVQITPNLIERANDPIWLRVNAVLKLDLLPRISTRAEIPAVAIGHFCLLVTSFMSGFFVGVSRRRSAILFSFAQYSILLYAIYGLLARVFTPNLLLWTPKIHYLGSVTATFVNHNTAATFIGFGVILWFCSAASSAQSLQYSSVRLLLLNASNERLALGAMLRVTAGLVCFLALLLTASRGGLICACFGLLIAVALTIGGRQRFRFWHGVGLACVGFTLTVVWLSGIGRIGSLGFLDTGRLSVYGACLEIISLRPLVGTGAGTFADIFPSVRPAEMNGWGVWDYAHSTILEIAVEMGIPMATSIVVAAVASLAILARAALKEKGHFRTTLSAVTGIAMLSYLHSLIDFSLQIPGCLIPFSIMLGCGMARATSGEQQAQNKMHSRETRSFIKASPSGKGNAMTSRFS